MRLLVLTARAKYGGRGIEWIDCELNAESGADVESRAKYLCRWMSITWCCRGVGLALASGDERVGCASKLKPCLEFAYYSTVLDFILFYIY